MSAIIRFRFRRLFIACLPALIVASSACAAERGLEKVRIAVSSKSLGFLDTWAARERGFYSKHGIDLPLDRVVDATIIEEVLRERR
jgi:ABC-type nitrate/sulfonate/bicarbonate transport system substrate-binding protein